MELDRWSVADPWTAALLDALAVTGVSLVGSNTALSTSVRLMSRAYWRWANAHPEDPAVREAERARMAVVAEAELARLGDRPLPDSTRAWLLAACAQRLADPRHRRRRRMVWWRAAAVRAGLAVGCVVAGIAAFRAGWWVAGVASVTAAGSASAFAAGAGYDAVARWTRGVADAAQSSAEAVHWWDRYLPW